ncbi:MAG: methylmalonyl-CoA epimerase [Anaerolineales bacterium]
MNEPHNINHLAIVVENMAEALVFWQKTLGLELDHVEEVSRESARVAFLPIGDSRIELVEPTDEGTGLSRFLEKRGPGFHHLCLEVQDLAAKLQQLEAAGVELINPEPVAGSDGRLYAFLHPKSAGGVLIELYQLPKED